MEKQSNIEVTLASKDISNTNNKVQQKKTTESFDKVSFKDVLENVKQSIPDPQTQARIEGAVGKLANFFGIGTTLMKEIMKSLGINEEDLLNTEKRASIVKMLTKRFLLSDEKSEKLEKLLAMC